MDDSWPCFPLLLAVTSSIWAQNRHRSKNDPCSVSLTSPGLLPTSHPAAVGSLNKSRNHSESGAPISNTTLGGRRCVSVVVDLFSQVLLLLATHILLITQELPNPRASFDV